MSAFVFFCDNCLIEWPDAACDCCGKSLVGRRHLAAVKPEPSPYLVLLNELAHDQWGRRVD